MRRCWIKYVSGRKSPARPFQTTNSKPSHCRVLGLFDSSKRRALRALRALGALEQSMTRALVGYTRATTGCQACDQNNLQPGNAVSGNAQPCPGFQQTGND
jgi:hypothetical protein